MARKAKYTDEMILEAARRLKAEHKEVSGWSVRMALGGGKVSRIEQVLSEHEGSAMAADPVMVEQVLTLPSQFEPQVQQIQEAIHNAACEMWRTSLEMAENRVRDEFTAANQARNEALAKMTMAQQVSDQQEEEIAELSEQVEFLHAEKKTLVVEQQQDRQTLAGLETANRAQADQVAELRRVTEGLEAEVEKERSVAAEMRGQCQAKEEQIRELKGDNLEFKTLLTAEKERTVSLNNDINYLTNNNETLTNDNQILTKQNERDRESLSSLKAVLSEKKERIKKLEADQSALSDQVKDLDKLKYLVEELTQEKDRLNGLAKFLNASEQKVKTLTEETAQLKEENKGLLKQVGKLEALKKG